MKVTYFRVTGTPVGTRTKLHEQLLKLIARLWCFYLCSKTTHSFVKGTVPRLVGLKLALQLCFALQARACLFSSWKQLDVETHKKPTLGEIQKGFFQDSLPSVCFSFLLPSLCNDHLFWLETKPVFKVSQRYIFLEWESLNTEAKFSATNPPYQLQNVNCRMSSESCWHQSLCFS